MLWELLEMEPGFAAGQEWGWQQGERAAAAGTLQGLWHSGTDYFFLLERKSLYLWEHSTLIFCPMHKSFPCLPWDSKQTPCVALSAKPVQNSVLPFLFRLAVLIQTQESVF